MTESEKREIKKLMQNEAAEWAMRECVRQYREAYMPLAMRARGYYESMRNVGFNDIEAITLTVNQINALMK